MTAGVPDDLPQRLSRLMSASPERAPAAAIGDWQAQARAALSRLPGPPPLRAIHHFACSGGTVICKALASMPNVTLLSEIDPLSPMGLPVPGSGHPTPFRPHDPLFHARAALRPPSDAVIANGFVAGLAALQAGLRREGRHLCLRDHAHSQFCTGADATARPTLRQMMQRAGQVRAVVTVRHPLASFVALRHNGWVTFTPDTVEAYATRYTAFLDAHDDVPILRYEDFAAAPEPFLERLCAALDLAYAPGAEAYLARIPMSGDSGRRSDRIAPRPPRPVPASLAEEARASAALKTLCDRLGYALEAAIPDG